MIFSAYNGGIQRTLDFCLVSTAVDLIDVLQSLSISSHKFSSAARKLLLKQAQQVLDNLVAKILITPNQKEAYENRQSIVFSSEVGRWLSTVRSFLTWKKYSFCCGNPQPELESGYGLRIDTFSYRQFLMTKQ